MQERLSINFLTDVIYEPEVCIRISLEAARAYHFPISRIPLEATEGNVISDGERLAHILRELRSHWSSDRDQRLRRR